MNLPKALAARALAASLVCLCALALVARGQEQTKSPQKQSDEDVVRVSTSLVQVDAVVVDKDGRVVTDLRPEDFRFVEDGKPRSITEFSFVSTASATTAHSESKSSESKSSESKSRADEDAAPTPPTPLAPGRARRTIALLVDDVGLSFETTAYVRKALTKFVDEQMQPGDLVAVIRTSGGAGSLQQFTSDRQQLRAAIERLRWYPVGRGGVAAVETMYPEDQDEVGLLLRGRRTSTKIDASGFEYFGGTLGALNYVVRGLGRFPGLRVRSRSGFYEAGSGEASRRTPATRDEQLREALTAPFNSGDLRVQLTALFADDSKLGTYVHTLIHVAARALKFKEEAGGWHTASFDLIAVAYDDAGKVAGQLGRSRTLRTRGTDYERLLREGFVYFIDLPLKRPGGYQLRAALRDSATGRLGSAGQFVEVPDLKEGRPALSGLIVNGANSGEASGRAPDKGSNARAGAKGAASLASYDDGRAGEYEQGVAAAETGPAVRKFRRGALLDYGFYVYGARLNPSTQRPSLTTELRLFHDGRPVFTGKPLPFDAAGQTDLKRLVAGGSFRLGTDLKQSPATTSFN